MQKVLVSLLFVLLTWPICAQQSNIIPQPAQFTFTRSLPFTLTVNTTLGGNNRTARSVALAFAEQIKVPTGYQLRMSSKGNILFEVPEKPDAQLGNEGYRLQVTQKTVTITANTEAGLFYGGQTLLQLFPAAIESPQRSETKWSIPACEITDYPRFGWRGLMLDVSRHFFSVADVKRYIDRMAKYKYNVLHWHLTDDEGWRIEIKSLPKLTKVGACRVPRTGRWGHHADPKDGEPTTDCGFYTQEQIKEIVAYAAARHIQVIPEIDVPGHSSAAVAAYPELCCTKDPSMKVNPGAKIADWYGNGQFKMLHDNTLNPSDPAVYAFLEKVFGEVATLFPFPYIHVGGDECYHGYWENDPNCQALMKKEGLKNTHELQSYFTKKVEQIVKAKGKKIIGWDEILEGGLAPEAAVMSWRGVEGGIAAAKLGHYVVMTPNDYVYTDLLQGDPLIEPDQTSYKTVRLKKCYNYEPVPEGIDPKYILGGQGNLWTEKVPTIRQAEYMTYPRALAIADMMWSQKENRNWDNFVQRMEHHFERMDLAGCNYARSAYDPIVTARMDNGKLLADVTSEVNGLDFYYTLDETLPDQYTPKYTGPITVPEGGLVNLKVISYRNGKPIGKMIVLPRDELVKRVGK